MPFLCSLLFYALFTVIAIGASSASAGDFTVKDAVSASWYVDVKNAIPVLGEEGETSLAAAAYSPDGQRAVFLTRQGDLEAGVTDYTLNLVTLADGDVTHRELVRLSSNSNEPAVSALRWMWNERIGFIGVRGVAAPQVMSVDISGKLIEHTRGEGEKIGFDIAADGTVVFSISVSPAAQTRSADGAGYFVGRKTFADIAGIKRSYWVATEYYVARRGKAQRLDGLSNGTSSFPPFISISPSGRYVVMATGPSHVPEEWTTFPMLSKAAAGAAINSFHSQLSLVDLRTSAQYELSGAPMAYPTNRMQIIWNEAKNRLILIDQFVSSEQAASLHGFADKLLPATFEFSLKTMRPQRLINVSPAPRRHAEVTAAENAHFDTATGKLEITRNGRLVSYQETPEGWRRESGSKGSRPALEMPFQLEVHQSVSEPAQIYALIAGQKDPIPVGEINAHLKDKYNPARLYEWTDEAGRKWQAGLTFPKSARQGKPLPLIIQTHTFSPHEFVITGDGGSSAGFSAQALASAGFAVLTMGFQNRKNDQTAKEFEIQSDGYRSAIKSLSTDGVINPIRVGITAWSRSGFWLQHALAFQDDLFAAAIASDASTFGKFIYLYFHNWPSMYQRDYLAQNGVSPFGEGLDRWRERDPVIHVKSFTTPLLIEDYGGGVPLWWESYVAMKEASEPVEYFILPSAPHDPIQPEHRFIVQTLTLDWFRFWLQGDEDPDPEKEEQYARWRKMREEQCTRLKGDEEPWYCDHGKVSIAAH